MANLNQNGTQMASEMSSTVVADSAIPTKNSDKTEQTNNERSHADVGVKNKDKFYKLSGVYERSDRLMIISHLSQYYLNTWKQVYDKVKFIADGEHKDPYFEEISEYTEVGCYYSEEDIIEFIMPLRRKLGLPAYDNNLVRNCVKDFFRLHMAEPKMSTEDDPWTKKPFIEGYTINFNLNCQIN